MKTLLVVLVLLKLCKSNDYGNEKYGTLNGVHNARWNRGFSGIKKVQSRENFWPVQKESRCKYKIYFNLLPLA